MTVVTILFALSLLSAAAKADTYCYYDAFNQFVCRDRFSIAARIGIAVAGFVVLLSILLAFTIYRRRRNARINMAYVHAAQSQQQGHQYPPPPTGQKAEYNGQSYSTYNEGYNGPQYPPAAYDQGHTPQPVPPYSGYGPPPGPPPHGNPYNV